MNRSLGIRAGLCFLLSANLLLAAPPAKPVPMTANQFVALRDLERQPQHQQVLNTRATYESEHERIVEQNLKANDVSTIATFLAYPLTVAAFLIIAPM